MGLSLGAIAIDAVSDGTFALDGGAMFGAVPRALWEGAHPPDAENRITLALRCLLIRSGARTVLVDTGVGDTWEPRERERYRIDRTHTLDSSLAALGVAREDVTDVVLSHLHFDHAGGVVRRAPNGERVLSFPRALHHVQRSNWAWAQKPSALDARSYLADKFDLLAESDRLRLHEGTYEIAPGVGASEDESHTVGQQLVLVEGGGRTLVYCADLIPTSTHLSPPWHMAYDLFPLRVLDAKRALLERAAREGWILAFDHDPNVAACTVRADGRRYEIAERIDL